MNKYQLAQCIKSYIISGSSRLLSCDRTLWLSLSLYFRRVMSTLLKSIFNAPNINGSMALLIDSPSLLSKMFHFNEHFKVIINIVMSNIKVVKPS